MFRKFQMELKFLYNSVIMKKNEYLIADFRDLIDSHNHH